MASGFFEGIRKFFGSNSKNVDELTEQAKQVANDALDDVRENAEHVADKISQHAKGAQETISKSFDDFVDKGGEIAQKGGEIVDDLREQSGDIIQKGSKIVDDLVDKGTDLAGDLREKGGKIVDDLVEKGEDLVGDVQDKASAMMGQTTKPSSTPTTPAGMNMSARIPITMRVNGRQVKGKVEARTLLVEFLRDHLQLTGTHVGCDTSQCGACVIHVNGKAVKSCTMLALQAQDQEILTIEGLSKNGELHPLQTAFQENHGLQCGFCTPGMIMSAADMIERAKASGQTLDEKEIRAQLEGNICRCTGYHNIVKSIKDASEKMA